VFNHHYTETEYLNGTDPVIDSICMKSEPSSDLSDISRVFESVEMLKYCQTIKGFDKQDFVTYYLKISLVV